MPKGLKFLIAFLVWGIYVDTTHLFFGNYASDITLFGHYGLTDIIYVAWFLALTLSLASIFFIMRRNPLGIKSLYSLFVLNIFMMLLTSALELKDLNLAREVFRDSREIRGLHTKNIEMIVSPIGILLMAFLYLLFYGALTRYISRTQSYFLIKPKNSEK